MVTGIKTPWFEGAAREGWCETAMYKSRTGDIGRVCRDLGLGTRDEGLGDIKYGTWGREGQGRGRR